ncbi:MAG: 4-hydroxybenzoate octaprenyltransferase, partial [Pseudomonadales bacterium]
MTFSKWRAFSELMRIERPIGVLLLLWPTLMALWIAGNGQPSLKNILIFSLGTFLMRSAGCVINDFADRDFDGHVERTRQRPLATGRVSSREAIALFVVLCTLAFGLVLLTNQLTLMISIAALAIAALYPFTKRFTQLPQLALGVAFSFGIPMAFAAESNSVPIAVLWLMLANISWTIAYDTFYAMVDRDDDIKIGVKSTAILFGQYDRIITALFQVLALGLLTYVGMVSRLGTIFFTGLFVSAMLMLQQQYLI